jgi:hypothetical protein
MHTHKCLFFDHKIVKHLQASCQEEGGALAEIHDADKNVFIYHKLEGKLP